MSRLEKHALCPYCDYHIEVHTGLTTDQKPSPGDAALCIRCAEFAVFGNGLELEKPSPEALAEILSDPEAALIQQKLHEVLMKRGNKQ